MRQLTGPARSAGEDEDAAALGLRRALDVLRGAEGLVLSNAGHPQHALSQRHHFPGIVAHILAAPLARDDHAVCVIRSVDQAIPESQEVKVDMRQDVIGNRRLLREAEVDLDVGVG